VSVGMSLVINSGFGFDRILCVYAGSECRKSTESSSTSSRTLRAALGSSVFLLCNFAEGDVEESRCWQSRSIEFPSFAIEGRSVPNSSAEFLELVNSVADFMRKGKAVAVHQSASQDGDGIPAQF
jgi:hypothetical protein